MARNTDMTLVRQQTGQLQQFLKEREGYLAKFVSMNIRPEVLTAWTVQEYGRPDNTALRQCSPASILLSLVAIAQWGLVPNKHRGEAYILPFRGEAVPIPGYRGLVTLARRSGIHPRARVVYEGDEFDILQGSDEQIVHRPCLNGKRGDIIGAYAIADVAGNTETCWMPVEDLEKVRNAAPMSNSPAWKQWPEEMYRKTPLRRLCKTLPLADAYFLAAAVDDRIATGDVAGIREIIDVDAEEMSAPAPSEPTATESLQAFAACRELLESADSMEDAIAATRAYDDLSHGEQDQLRPLVEEMRARVAGSVAS